MSDELFCGVDIGAAATKVVLVDGTGDVSARVVQLSGVDYEATARGCTSEALEQAGLPESAIQRTVATGYGRKNVSFADRAVTEILAHGVGCYHHAKRAITVIDIGGQDNKVIRLGDDGKRIDFRMNRKCAAGTGSFIEEIALRLAMDVSEMEGLAKSTEESVKLSSFCTVFAKTEILSHLRAGVPVAQIVRGAFNSVINRVVEMDPLNGEVVMTGGVVAHNPTVADILSKRLGRDVIVPPHPQFTGALGAALEARRDVS